MIDTPQIIQIQARPTAMIRLTIPKDQIQQVMGPGISELMEVVTAQGAGPAGPWFTHHLKIDDAGWDFEISVPVTKPVVATGRVRPAEWPAMKAVRSVYYGGYEGMGSAWGELMDWMEANRLAPADDLYECYVAGPESGPDPEGWKTEFTKPLAV